MSKHPLWWNGPQWLQHKARWPPDIVPNACQETLAEAKATRDVFALPIAETDELDTLLEKFSYWKVMRICTWIMRFICNVHSKKMRKLAGPLTTEETNKANVFWVKRVQTRAPLDKYYQKDQLQLNLQPNSEGVLECRGRIQGHYHVYLPDSQRYTEKFVTQAHLTTLHGGVVSTMAKVREQYWVPHLRRLTKRVVNNRHECRRFQPQAFSSPPQGNLPKDRTEGQTPFQVVGVDYAGPLKYRKGAKTEGKAYVLLYACSLTRAFFLDLLPSLESTEFLASFKRFIARRGRPQKVYSDNGKTFVGAVKWIKQVMGDEKFQNFLTHQGIQWQFNLSRAPW